MPASNPTYGKCSDRNLQRNRENCGRFHYFVWPQLEVGALTASLLNALVGVLLIWPLPYRVSRTFTFLLVRDRPGSLRPAGFQQQQQDGKALQWASEEMKGDRELCTAAVAQDWRALEHAPNDMKRDLNMLLAAFQKPGLKFAAKDNNDEKTMIMATLKLRWTFLGPPEL